MANLIIIGEEETECDQCNAIFTLYWRRSPLIDKVEYCPFCGDDIEEIIGDTDE